MSSTKPGLRVSVSEWLGLNQQLSDTARHERDVSTVIRQEGRSLRNETDCLTNWDETDTSRRLSDRIWGVSRWKDALESCAMRVDEEMNALTLCKAQTEQALADTVTPLTVSRECLTVREGRRGFELVLDPVHEELKKEVELIERVQQVLQEKIDKSFEHLCVLQEARQQLTADLQNKMDALDIDMSCLSLTRQSPQISLKVNPTRIPPGSSTPQEWVQFTRYNIARAQEAMQVSQDMREDIDLTRAQLQNELETQRRATEFAHRKRNHQEEQAYDELQWQIQKTKNEIEDLEKDIVGLDTDMRAKTFSLKLAHTRLENRTYRPGMDLCRDEVQHGLVHEVQQLEASILALKQKLAEAQHSLQRLKLHLSRMLQDLSTKRESLSLEQRSMTSRSHLKSLGRTGVQTEGRVLVVPLTNSSGRSKLQLQAA